jgi:hypothetical protein
LKAVDGTGKVRPLSKHDNGTAILQALLGFDGYINVHLSADKLALLLRKATLDKTTLLAYRKYIHWEALLLQQ